ncbi:MAG: cupin domain-containing protein [Bacteroidales bacterium]
MKVNSLNDAPRVTFDLDGRILLACERTELVHLQFQPGEALSPHSNPVDVIFYCLEGKAELTVGEEIFHLTQDSCILVPSALTRSWKNSDVITRLLVIKLM